MSRLRILSIFLILALLLTACTDEEEALSPTSAPSRPASSSASSDTWLVMLYSDADDQVLEQDMVIDLNEAERAGSSEQVTIVAQVDRYRGGFKGDDNWHSARRIEIQQDDDLDQLNSHVVEDLGEVNMADGQTLIDFVVWATETYPADHHVLILSDHGMGWPGGWSDASHTDPGPDGLGLTADGDMLLLDEIDAALEEIRSQTGIAAFELIGFDACLMGQIEVVTAMAPHANYVVASEELEPALGWAYASFLGELVADPGMDGATLATLIVDSYIHRDERIVDDRARAMFVEENFDTRAKMSAEEVAADMSLDVTLAAYDTAALPDLLAALDELSLAMSESAKKPIASARTYAQRFENTFGDGPSPYIDLGNFAALLKQKTDDENVQAAADQLLDALQAVVIAETHGEARPGATGLSIYFPTSKLYKSRDAGRKVYAQVASRFADEAAWENYLDFYYYDVAMEAPRPSDVRSLVAPGASELTLADLVLSASEINQAEAVTVDISVDGEQIGFIYFFTGFYNPEDDSILVADVDYIDAGASLTINGVSYPDWGEERPVEFSYDWEPVRYGINDGNQTIFALFEPWDYGDEVATYVVRGTYTFSDGNSRPAQLFFKDYELIKVLGFSPQGEASAPSEIRPQDGDTFTVENQIILLHSDDPDAEEEYITVPGSSVTFGTQPLSMEEMIAPAGDYVLGVQAEDMDGNIYETYTSVFVNE
nr:clostripain-related cysteine peptidase [Oscillochloris trichoides]